MGLKAADEWSLEICAWSRRRQLVCKRDVGKEDEEWAFEFMSLAYETQGLTKLV